MIERFLAWIFSFFPARHNPSLPVITVQPTKSSLKRAMEPGGYVPVEGSAWNPLQKYPRNEPCYCGSGKKFKKCCLPFEPLAIDQAVVESARPHVQVIRASRGVA